MGLDSREGTGAIVLVPPAIRLASTFTTDESNGTGATEATERHWNVPVRRDRTRLRADVAWRGRSVGVSPTA